MSEGNLFASCGQMVERTYVDHDRCFYLLYAGKSNMQFDEDLTRCLLEYVLGLVIK